MSEWAIERDNKARAAAAERIVTGRSVCDFILNDENRIHPRPTPYTHRGACDYTTDADSVDAIAAAFASNEEHYDSLRWLHMNIARLHAGVQYALATQDEQRRRDELTKALSFLEHFAYKLFLQLKDHKAFFQLHLAEASGRKIQMDWERSYVNREELISKGIGELNSNGEISWQLYPAAEFPAIEGEACDPINQLQREQHAVTT